jgi:cardiolipin synthase A/B
LRLIATAGGALVILQALTVAALVLVDRRRKRRQPPAHFPHGDLPSVTCGDNTLQLYTHGVELYDAMLTAIEQARDAIYLETYIWKADALGERFKEALIRKAREGVAVYVVFDWFGNVVVPHAFKRFPAPVHALAYRPIRRPRHLLDPRRYALEHRKLLVVDGETAFLGGYNIGAVYATEWRDTHVRMEGPAARRLAQEFIDFWNRKGPPKDHIERRYAHGVDPTIMIRSTDALRLTFPIRDLYLLGIEGAERQVLLTSAYFVPDRVLLDALKGAAARGVDVQVLVPWTSNHIVADWASHAYFAECLRSGIRIFGYQHAMIHAKTCTVDGAVSTIGTANLDRLSSFGNYEINVAIFSAELARQMEGVFATDKTNAIELTPDAWRSRPWYVKASERIIKTLRFVL